jgi:hypothetical protein
MDFYVAGRFKEYRRVRALIDDLVSVGHRCTHDWTRTAEFDQDGEPTCSVADGGAFIPEREAREHALADMSGATSADFLVVLADEKLVGGWIEVGMALAVGTERIYIVDPRRHTIFFSMPGVRVCSEDEMRSALQLPERVV